MTAKQEKKALTEQLKEKLTRLDYPDFETAPGEENVVMLHIQSRLICSVTHAVALSDEALGGLIDETVRVGGD
jgi:hypothetical protein